jgi:hypothetical protein
VDPFEKKLPDPSRKTWDGSASAKLTCTGKGCLCSGRPFFGRASIFPAKTKLIHYARFTSWICLEMVSGGNPRHLP